MKNKFVQRLLASSSIIILGIIEINFNSSTEFNFAYFNIAIGSLFLLFTVLYQIKNQSNRKEIDCELSKEYDERDDLIDGKVAKFTLSILIYIILIIMFISNFIIISTGSALMVLLIACISIEVLSRKYYNHII